MSYPGNLTDEQRAKIEPFFVRPDPRGARAKYPKRRMVEACLYRLREGCRWRALPHDSPPCNTLHDHFTRWQERGVWQETVAVLGTRWREHKEGFVPVAFRWRVERTFAWLGQCRLLAKAYQRTVRSAKAWFWCAMMRLLIRRLA